jgi:hypothetical protein
MRMSEERLEREARLRGEVESIYEQLTDGLFRHLRLTELVYGAAERHRGLVPTGEAGAPRRSRSQGAAGRRRALDVFRRYMASYVREQALCMYSDAPIDNLEHNWNARQRTP